MRYLLALVISWPISAQAGWFSYDNYEDCMLGRMKGQAQSMYSNADKLCKKEFKIEFEVWTSDVDWSFAYSPLGSRIRLDKVPEEYNITKGKFIFSSKACEGLKNEDFDKACTVEFKDGDALIVENEAIKCGKAVSFTGKYK
jgi:hypothetical protein